MGERGVRNAEVGGSSPPISTIHDAGIADNSGRWGLQLADKFVLYTHPDCTYSDALKEELNAAGTQYEEIDLALHPEAWADLEALTAGERITPVMVEGDAVSVGFHGVG